MLLHIVCAPLFNKGFLYQSAMWGQKLAHVQRTRNTWQTVARTRKGQETRPTTSRWDVADRLLPWQKCCRQTFRDNIFITFALIAWLWFEICQNLVTTTNCAAESKEKSTIVKIHVLPQLVRVCVKSSHCSLWSQFTRVSFIHLIMTFPSTHWYVFMIQIWKGRATAKPEKSEKAGKPQQICGRRQVSTMNCNVWTVFTIDGGQCSIYIPTVTLYMAVPYSYPIYGSSL